MYSTHLDAFGAHDREAKPPVRQQYPCLNRGEERSARDTRRQGEEAHGYVCCPITNKKQSHVRTSSTSTAARNQNLRSSLATYQIGSAHILSSPIVSSSLHIACLASSYFSLRALLVRRSGSESGWALGQLCLGLASNCCAVCCAV